MQMSQASWLINKLCRAVSVHSHCSITRVQFYTEYFCRVHTSFLFELAYYLVFTIMSSGGLSLCPFTEISMSHIYFCGSKTPERRKLLHRKQFCYSSQSTKCWCWGWFWSIGGSVGSQRLRCFKWKGIVNKSSLEYKERKILYNKIILEAEQRSPRNFWKLNIFHCWSLSFLSPILLVPFTF